MSDTVPLNLRKISVVRYLLSDRHPIALRRCQYHQAHTEMFDMHYELEVGVVMAGRITRQFLTGEADYSVGEAWLHPALEPHGCIIAEVPCDLLVFVIRPELLESGGSHGTDWMYPFLLPPGQRPRGDARVSSELLRLSHRLSDMAEAGNREIDAWTEVVLFEMLLLLRESLPDSIRLDESSRYITNDIQPALSIVYESRHHVDVDDAADACNMNQKKFRTRFAELMGTSFAKFALNHRLNGAATQLVSTSDPIKLIASDWGFRDISHLTKCFLARYSVTPGEYRKRNPDRAGIA